MSEHYPDGTQAMLAKLGDQLQTEDDQAEDDYGAINDPPEPDEDRDTWPASSFFEELPPIPAAGWDELDCGGVYDGFQVTSDADPGL